MEQTWLNKKTRLHQFLPWFHGSPCAPKKKREKNGSPGSVPFPPHSSMVLSGRNGTDIGRHETWWPMGLVRNKRRPTYTDFYSGLLLSSVRLVKADINHTASDAWLLVMAIFLLSRDGDTKPKVPVAVECDSLISVRTIKSSTYSLNHGCWVCTDLPDSHSSRLRGWSRARMDPCTVTLCHRCALFSSLLCTVSALDLSRAVGVSTKGGEAELLGIHKVSSTYVLSDG